MAEVESIKTKVFATPKVEMGIELIATSEYRGLVCECGNTDYRRFIKFVSKTLAKDNNGQWTHGEKLYLRCLKCRKMVIYTQDMHMYLLSMSGIGKPARTPRRTKILKPTKKQEVIKKIENKKERTRKKAGRPRKK